MRIVKFISLKIVESAGILLALYLGTFYHNWICSMLDNQHEKHLEYYWVLQGLLGLMLLFISIAIPALIIMLIILWIKQNWEWSE